MHSILPVLLIDGYKTGHIHQYPNDTQFVYSNMTPRGSRVKGSDHVVVFGLQHFFKKYLIDEFNNEFFNRPNHVVLCEFEHRIKNYLGPNNNVGVKHIDDLHNLGYLPIRVKTLDEGTLCPVGVPVATVVNTHADFGWLTNSLETLMSTECWGPMTSATTAYLYRKEFERAYGLTGLNREAIKYMGHDFSMRGMFGLHAAILSDMGHLTSFIGTDTLPGIEEMARYYGDERVNGVIGCSVNATEHSVMCMGGEDNEIETYRRLLTEVYPTGILSVVSDTWDFWDLMTNGLSELYPDIMGRDGKFLPRPDSGDPVDVICGDPTSSVVAEQKGAFEILYDRFPGELIEGVFEDFDTLDPHVGLIYGDSITLERQKAIHERLMAKGFAPDVVLGIGSYSYQHVTRDTYGFAIKATYGVVGDKPRSLQKTVKTDSKKRSHRGLLRVDYDKGVITCYDDQTPEQEALGLLTTAFENSKLVKEFTLKQIRTKLHGSDF